MELKINNKAEFHALKDLIFITLFFDPAIILLPFFIPNLLVFFALIAFYLALYFLPTILLHSNYEQSNENEIFYISEKKLIYRGNTITESQIQKIKAYGTPKSLKIEEFSRMTHMSGYFYVEIITNLKEKIILTSLLSKDLIEIVESEFPNIKIKKIKTFYPSIK